MSTFIYILGLLVACVGTAIVAKSFKPPFGPLGVLLIVVGVSICIFILFSKKIEKWKAAKNCQKRKPKEKSMGQGSP